MTLAGQNSQPQQMRVKIVEEYETLTRLHGARGPTLEIPHGPRQHAISLSKFMAGQERHVLVRGESGESGGVLFHQGDANDMSGLFDDECFATVIWDRAIDRDPAFWLTLAEIRRVLQPGGVLIVCAQGFSKVNKFGVTVTGTSGKAVPFLTATASPSASTADFWRLSGQAMRRVIFKDFDLREMRLLWMKPHLFGVGVKPER